jgi:hypothetical protein
MTDIPYSKYETHKGIVPYERQVYYGWDGTKTYEVEYWNPPRNTSRWMNGNKRPHWREDLKRHLPTTTQFEGFEDKLIQKPAFVSKQFVMKPGYPKVGNEYHEVSDYIRTYNWYNPDGLSSWTTEAENEAKRKFVNQVRNAQTTFQGGTFLAELGKTIAFIKSPVKSLRRRLNYDLRKVQKVNLPRSVRRLPKPKLREVLADTWLEIQYGLKPLINDADDALRTVAESNVLVDNQYISCVGVGSKEVVTHSGPFTQASAGLGFSYMLENIESCRVRLLGQVDSGMYAMTNMRRIGLDPSNWLPTAWEIVPWSFLIDYFSNVGDIISAASMARSGIVWINRTERRSYVSKAYNCRPYGVPAEGPDHYEFLNAFTPPKFSYERKKVYRIDYTSQSLVPTLEISIPGTGTKWLNIAALFAGRREMRDLVRR